MWGGAASIGLPLASTTNTVPGATQRAGPIVQTAQVPLQELVVWRSSRGAVGVHEAVGWHGPGHPRSRSPPSRTWAPPGRLHAHGRALGARWCTLRHCGEGAVSAAQKVTTWGLVGHGGVVSNTKGPERCGRRGVCRVATVRVRYKGATPSEDQPALCIISRCPSEKKSFMGVIIARGEGKGGKVTGVGGERMDGQLIRQSAFLLFFFAQLRLAIRAPLTVSTPPTTTSSTIGIASGLSNAKS